MRKFHISILILPFLLFACSGDKEDYQNAAYDLCECMQDKFDLRSKDTLGLEVELKNMYFAKCMLELKSINPYDSMMREAIKSTCPQASDLYEVYSKMK